MKMGTWSENWKATHAPFVKANKDVKAVMEHRNLENGEIYCVALNKGGFEVRQYVDGKIKSKAGYPSGMKAVLAYRELRDKLVPSRTVAKKEKEHPKANAKAMAQAIEKGAKVTTTKKGTPKPKATTPKAKATTSK